MRPFNGGGEMIREVARDWVTYGDPPHKFEAGTPAIVESIGLGAAIDYVNSIGKERIAAHEHDLLNYAQERLREINSLRLIGTARGKGPVISFEMKGAHPHDVATVIDRQGIAVRAGTHCVMPLLERFNVTATCRASFGMYNTREEVDHLAQALIKARELFSMSDTAEVKTANMETQSALPPEETERLGTEIVVFSPTYSAAMRLDCSVSQMRKGVAGIAMSLTPRASVTALMTAGGEPIAPASPQPFMPNGFAGAWE